MKSTLSSLSFSFALVATACVARSAEFPETTPSQDFSRLTAASASELRVDLQRLRASAQTGSRSHSTAKPLGALLTDYHLSLDDKLPQGGETLGAFLKASGIDPTASAVTVDAREPLSARLSRWGIDENVPITVASPEAFRVVILATLESYFRVHPDGPPAESRSPLSRDDQFANALLRETFGHDIYGDSLTRPGSPGLIDGSVLFETALAPVETGNDDLLRSRFLLLSQLEMIRMDSEDGVMNGREQKLQATRFFDASAGTHYAGLVESCSPALTAVVDPRALRGPSPLPLSLPALQDIADRNHLPVETFVRSLIAFHALATGGVKDASSTPPFVWKRWDYTDAEGALGPVPPRPLGFGFIDYLFEAPVKDLIRADQTIFARTRVDPYLYGDESHPGTLGPDGFMNRILFGNFGASCKLPAPTP